MEGLTQIKNQEVQKTVETQPSVEFNPAQNEAEQKIAALISEMMSPEKVQELIAANMTVERTSERN